MQPVLPFDAIAADLPRAVPKLPTPESRTANSEPRTPNAVVTFVRHPRARRYVIRGADDGGVRVTVPRWGSKREAAAFVAEQHAWIAKQQQRVARERTTREASAQPRLTADELRALQDRARRELPPRLLELAEQCGVVVTRVSIRNQRWRWGSCSRRGHICLNWRLATMPADVRDYVLVHELMHLKRMDHSPKFWKLVADVCPDYQAARAYLRASCRD
jgi:predicted metal-dependent hydrolase